MPLLPRTAGDLTYAELVEEARSLIPGLDPGWTNHNPSDPGVTLLELFAWLSEMLMYRANQVSDGGRATFLKLLHDPATQGPLTGALDEQIRQAVLALRTRYRAVTSDDYEYLLREVWPQTPEAALLGDAARLSRVHCLPRRDLTTDPLADSPAHVSVVVVPTASRWSAPYNLTLSTLTANLEFSLATPGRLIARAAWTGAPAVQTLAVYKWVGGQPRVVDQRTGPSPLNFPYNVAQADLTQAPNWGLRITSPGPAAARGILAANYRIPQVPSALVQALQGFLDGRRLLTTFPKVVGPTYFPVTVNVRLVLRPDALPTVVSNAAVDALRTFFEPLDGGLDGTGWPLGRDIYVSDIFSLMDRLPGVDYVADDGLDILTFDPSRRQIGSDGRVTGLTLQPWELPDMVGVNVWV